MSEALTVVPTRAAALGEMTIEAVIDRKRKMVKVMEAVMREGEHYGRIPGCGPKPTLLKAGAEVLAMTFGLAPTFRVDSNDLPNGHREYEVTCTLTHIASGTVISEGLGCGSTMESKHRWRRGNNGGARVENTDPADVFNTVLKMAQKRALVGATLIACGASDLLTQDIEDLPPGSGDTENRSSGKPEASQHGLVERFDACSTVTELRALDTEMRTTWEKIPKRLRDSVAQSFKRAETRIKQSINNEGT